MNRRKPVSKDIEVKVEEIELNGVTYLKKSDVDKHYVRNDKREVNKAIIFSNLRNMDNASFLKMMRDTVRVKLNIADYADLEQIRDEKLAYGPLLALEYVLGDD